MNAAKNSIQHPLHIFLFLCVHQIKPQQFRLSFHFIHSSCLNREGVKLQVQFEIIFVPTLLTDQKMAESLQEKKEVKITKILICCVKMKRFQFFEGWYEFSLTNGLKNKSFL